MNDRMSSDQQGEETAITALPALPPGWCWATLRELLRGIEAGKSFECLQRTAAPDEWGIIKVSAMTWGVFDEEENKAVPPGREIDERAEIRAGDILLSRSNTVELVGATVHVRHCRPRLLLSDKSLRLLPHSELHGNWLQVALSSAQARRQLSASATGTSNSMRNVSQEKVLNVQVALPPLDEQSRIVAKVEELVSDVDAGIATLRRAKANLKRYRAAVLKAAVEGKLTEEWRASHPAAEPASSLLERILAERRRRWEEEQQAKFTAASKTPPKGWQRKYVEPAAPDTTELPEPPVGWCWATVEQLAQPGEQPVTTGPFGSMLGREDFVETGVPLLTIGCLQESGLDMGKAVYISETKASALARYRLREGDLLFSRSASVGRVGIVTESLEGALLNYHLMRLRLAGSLVLPSYFVTFVRGASVVTDYLRKVNRGATRDGINSEALLAMPVALPPHKEQCAIAFALDSILSGIRATEDVIRRSELRSAQLRRSILAEAFAGRLVPQESADEPASVLLQRIQERATSSKQDNRESPAGRNSPSPRGRRPARPNSHEEGTVS